MPQLPQRVDLLTGRLDRFTRMLPGLETADERAVHRARVASRRLRELVPILQLDRQTADDLGDRLREVTRRLGAVRELDVLLGLTNELQGSPQVSERVLRHMAVHVRLARDEARHKVTGKRAVTERRRLARKLERIARQTSGSKATEAGDRAWRWAIDARVARRAAAVARAVDAAGALYLPERLHAVRIAVKKLRYGLELANDAAAVPPTDDLKLLRKEQVLLGRMHDLQVLIDRARRVQASLPPSEKILQADINRLLSELDKSCRRLHARYVRDREKILDVCRHLAARTPPASKAAIRGVG